MGQLFLSGDYCFFQSHFQNSHYYDSRSGCVLNYLALLLKGTVKLVCEDRTVEAKDGDVIFFPKGLRYQSYWHGEPEIHFLSFGFSTMPAGDQKNYFLQTVNFPENLPDLLQKIPTAGKQVDSYTLSLFYSALAQAIPHLAWDTDTGSGLANTAAAYMRDHPHDSIPQVAQACGISQPYLYATFRQYTGVTPNYYRQSILCQTAVELLATTDKTVEEISALLHFSSAAYLRKVLHQHTGMTPTQIRKSAHF